MAQSQFLTQSDAQTIGWELASRTPDNQLDVWQRLFYMLERAIPQDSQCVSRFAAINEALYQLRLFPVPCLELTVPVTPEEAVRLIAPGIALNFDNLMRFQSLLYEAADQLGDQPATMPLYALWDTLDARSYRLIHDLTYGQQEGTADSDFTAES